MSFASQVKQELVAARPRQRLLRQAQALGLFAFARSFSPDAVALWTESGEIAALYRDCLRAYCPKGADIEEGQIRNRGKLLHTVSLPREQDRKALLARVGARGMSLAERFPTQNQAAAVLAGAFLACGHITDPEKSYHLEFVVREQPLAEELAELLGLLVTGVGRTCRRGAELVYCKECAQIEDLLTLMGASKASLAMVEVEIVKGVRNRAMRQTNCETANIDKTVTASSAQIEDIELILRVRGLESLPETLGEAALARLENPELSLRELAATFEPPLSRSGMHHRLAALGKIAAKIREAGEGEGL